MQKHLSTHTVNDWANSFLNSLEHTQPALTNKSLRLNRMQSDTIATEFSFSDKRTVLLDYDGTLVPFFTSPERAKPPGRILRLLSGLAKQINTEIILISGRSQENLEEWFGSLPLTLVAEHGAAIKREGKWQTINSDPDWMPAVHEKMREFMNITPDSFIEQKRHSIVWHYRQSPAYRGNRNASRLYASLVADLSLADLGIFKGSKIIEVKPLAVNKGAAALNLVDRESFVLCIGDDYTDEEMFAALPKDASTIKVGRGKTTARYRLPSPESVVEFLEKLLSMT
jgi:trehalose 6-phosphate synthase/phosphatase